MGLTGGDGLTKIRAAALTMPKVMSQASRDAAEELEDLIEAQFAHGVDPFGEEWAALSPATLKKGRHPPPLTDEGLLRAAHVAPLQSAGLEVSFDEDYAEFHQSGTGRMPKRQLVPEPEQFDQSKWKQAIVVAYSNAILKNGGWRAAGAEVDEASPLSAAAE
jgi:phage gpG-like protein